MRSIWGLGRNKYLGHELGHVVQQKQGRVKAEFNLNGIPVNDDKALEDEADAMSMLPVQKQAIQCRRLLHINVGRTAPVQRIGDKLLLSMENTESMAIELKELADGIKLKYDDYKKAKKDKRLLLDAEVKTKTNNLKDKQEYLWHSLLCEYYEKYATEIESYFDSTNFTNKISTLLSDEQSKRTTANRKIAAADKAELDALVPKTILIFKDSIKQTLESEYNKANKGKIGTSEEKPLKIKNANVSYDCKPSDLRFQCWVF